MSGDCRKKARKINDQRRISETGKVLILKCEVKPAPLGPLTAVSASARCREPP
jgi:hypothetical protein